MTTYDVTAWCSVPYYTTFEVDAGDADEALGKAKLQVRNEYGEPCSSGESEWDEFEISSEGEDAEIITYLEPSRLAQNAAEDLLSAAKFALPLLEVLGGSNDNKKERKAFYKLRDAIAKATEQQGRAP
jgi:hypothetical protein